MNSLRGLPRVFSTFAFLSVAAVAVGCLGEAAADEKDPAIEQALEVERAADVDDVASTALVRKGESGKRLATPDLDPSAERAGPVPVPWHRK